MGATRSLKRNRRKKEQEKNKDNPLYKEQKKLQKTERKANRGLKRAYVDQLVHDMQTRKNALHNLSAVFMCVMHEQYGFGLKRLKRLHDKMQNEMDCIVYNYISVEEIAAFLREEIKLDVGVDAKDPRANHDRQIEFEVVKEMSAAFLMALLDEFGFKAKRLGDAYGYAAGLSDMLNHGETTYEEIGNKMAEVMTKGGKNNEDKKNNATSGG